MYWLSSTMSTLENMSRQGQCITHIMVKTCVLWAYYNYAEIVNSCIV